jgi:hypothetical protein
MKMPNYTRVDSYDSTKGYSRVHWGQSSKILDTELTEMQKILAGFTNALGKTIFNDGFVNRPALTYSGGTLTVPADTIISGGRVITIADNMTISVGNNTTVYLAVWEAEVAYTDTVYRSGNQSGGQVIANNGIFDSAVNFETSKRVQLQVQLVTSNADSSKSYLPVAYISSGGALTDNRQFPKVTLTGLLTASGGLTVPSGQTLTVNGSFVGSYSSNGDVTGAIADLNSNAFAVAIAAPSGTAVDPFGITTGGGASAVKAFSVSRTNVVASKAATLDDGNGNATFRTITSNVTTGTAPLTVTSTTKVANLNADLLDGYDTATGATASTVAVRDASANLTANAFTSTVATGTAPLAVTSTTKVTNLNADLLDGMDSATGATASTIAARDSSGDLTSRRFISTITTGTAPFSVTSTTAVTNLNADMVDGFHLDQDIRTTASPSFAGLTVNGNETISASGVATGATNYASNQLKFNRSYWTGSAAANGTSYLQVDSAGALNFYNESSSSVAKVDQSGNVTARTLISNVTTGTAPLTVTSTTKVANLNVDQVDGYDFDQPLRTTDSPTFVKATFTQATGTAPFTVTSTTSVTNLSADMVDGYHLDQDVRTTASPTHVRLTLSQADGTAPMTVTSKTKVANLNVDQVDGYDFDQSLKTTDSPTFVKAIFTQTTGTAPFTVSSTSLVSNLNADMVDGYNLDQDVRTTASPTHVRLTLSQADGTAPMTVTSKTKVANLNVDQVDGFDFDQSLKTTDSPTFVKAIFTQATGTAPFTVSSTTKVTNLNADLLDGYDTSTSGTANTITLRDANGRTQFAYPAADNDAATKGYVDETSSPSPVRVATTANITLSGTQTIDGVSVIAGDRVLVKNQTTGSQNGIYVVASGSWTRANDADTSAKVKGGMAVRVLEGTTQGSTCWMLTTTGAITLGSTSLTFTQLDAPADNSTLEFASKTIRIKDGGVTDAKIGNRTITDTTAQTGGAAATLTTLFGQIGNMIKGITGKPNWYTAPTITLEDAYTSILAHDAAVINNPAPTPITLVNGQQIVNTTKAGLMQNFNAQGRTLVNLLGRDGGMENIGALSSFQSTLTADTSKYVNGTQSVKITATTNGIADAYTGAKLNLFSGSYYFIAGWVWNNNAPSMQIGIQGTAFAASTSTQGSWQYIYGVFSPVSNLNNVYAIARVNASASGQYGWADSLVVYQITQAEYNAIQSSTYTAAQLQAKYPYVDDVKHLSGLYVTRYGENLCPDFSQWGQNAAPSGTTYSYNSPYSITITSSSNASESIVYINNFYGQVPLIPGQTYTWTVGGTIGSYTRIALIDSAGNVVRRITTALNPSGVSTTFTAASNEVWFGVNLTNSSNTTGTSSSSDTTAGTFTYTNPRLNIGSVDKGFEPRNDDMMIFPVSLASSVDGTVYDQIFHRDGRYWRENRIQKDMVIDGALPWAFAGSATGFKWVTASGVFKDRALAAPLAITKYDGKQLSYGGANLAADVFGSGSWSDLNNYNVTISISSADSGWGDAYTPTAAEIQAYFNGWVMYRYDLSDPSQPYNGTGTKGWCYRRGNFTGSPTPSTMVGWTSTLPTTPAPIGDVTGNFKWSPYRLTYQLATPTFDDLTTIMDGEVNLLEGANQIEVGAGMILREKASPATNGTNWFIGSATLGSATMNRVGKFLLFYRNGKIDNQWSQYPNDGTGYGNYIAKELGSYYDPTATYETTYKALDQYLLTVSPVTTITAEYDTNIKTVQDRQGQRIADYGQRLSVVEQIAARTYQMPTKSVQNVTMYVDVTNGSDSGDGSAAKPFKTIGKAVSMIPQVINHQYIINVAPGTYNEDVILNGFVSSAITGSGASLGVYGINLIATNPAKGATNINSAKITSCKGRFEINGFTATTTADMGFAASYSQVAIFYSCWCTGATGTYPGFTFTSSMGRIQLGESSNRYTGITAQYYSIVYVDSVAGTGNTYGILSQVASYVGASNGTLPQAATVANNIVVGGGSTFVPSGSVMNPWGDNTGVSRSCAYATAAGQSLTLTTLATWYKIPFATELKDNLGEYDNTTNYRFTAKHSGTYLVALLVSVMGMTSGAKVNAAVYKNGTLYEYTAQGALYDGTGQYSGTGQAFVIDLNAGDYLEIWAQQSNGGTPASINPSSSWVKYIQIA